MSVPLVQVVRRVQGHQAVLALPKPETNQDIESRIMIRSSANMLVWMSRSLTTGPGTPLRPSGPGFPGAPWGPTGPVLPAGPSRPDSPWDRKTQLVTSHTHFDMNSARVSLYSTLAPFSPCLPSGPAGPWGPWRGEMIYKSMHVIYNSMHLNNT